MTILERSVLFIVVTATVSGIGGLAALTLDTRTTTATLDIRMKAIEAHGDPAPQLAGIEAKLVGLTNEVASLRNELEQKGRGNERR